MSHHGYICLNDISLEMLTPDERERFNVVWCELRTDGQKGIAIDFPPAVARELWGIWMSSTPTALPKSLFSRLAYTDMTVTVLPEGSKTAERWHDQRSAEVGGTLLLSTLIDYFLSVIKDQPFLEKRSYISYVALFLTHVIIDRSVASEKEIFEVLYNRLCQFPAVRVSESLHSTIPYPSETLSAGIGVLRCLSRGYGRPPIDLIASFAGQEGQICSVEQLVNSLSDPCSEEIVANNVGVRKLFWRPQYKSECREAFRAQAKDTFPLFLSDMVVQVVMSPYDNERESVFVLRRLSNVIAQMLNSSVKGEPCDAYADVFPWLYQCREKLLLWAVSKINQTNIISPDKQQMRKSTMNKAIDHKVRIVLDILRHQIDKDYGWPTTVPLYDLDVYFLNSLGESEPFSLFDHQNDWPPIREEHWLIKYRYIHKNRTLARVTDADQLYTELPHAYRLSHIVHSYAQGIKHYDEEYDYIADQYEPGGDDDIYVPEKIDYHFDSRLERIRLDFALFLTTLVIAPDEKDDALIRVLTERFYLQLLLLKNNDGSLTEIHLPSIPKNTLNR